MHDIKEKIDEILDDINPSIASYTGGDLIGDNIIDSFDIVDIAFAIEEEFNIEIDAAYVIKENFCTAENVAKLVQKIVENNG